jgi:acetoin utilization protein AcuB
MITVEQTLAQAHAVMRAHEIRHLPVTRAGELVGMLTQRDLWLIETLKDVNPDEVTVEEAMSPVVYAVAPDAPLEQVIREMADQKYGSAVAIHNGAVVGILTAVDVCRAFAEMLSTRAARRTTRGPQATRRTSARLTVRRS